MSFNVITGVQSWENIYPENSYFEDRKWRQNDKTYPKN